jgi:hypothetical protein
MVVKIREGLGWDGPYHPAAEFFVMRKVNADRIRAVNMLKALRTEILSFAIVLLALSCSQAAEGDWPQYVRDNIWVPSHATDVQRTVVQTSYQLTYSVKACFPARDILQGATDSMTSAGWKRLAYDPLNPGEKLSFALEQENKGLGKWWSTYPWKDVWRDKKGNVVFYRFSYDVANPLPDVVQKSCALKCFAAFFPKELHDSIVKAVEEKRREGPKR